MPESRSHPSSINDGAPLHHRLRPRKVRRMGRNGVVNARIPKRAESYELNHDKVPKGLGRRVLGDIVSTVHVGDVDGKFAKAHAIGSNLLDVRSKHRAHHLPPAPLLGLKLWNNEGVEPAHRHIVTAPDGTKHLRRSSNHWRLGLARIAFIPGLVFAGVVVHHEFLGGTSPSTPAAALGKGPNINLTPNTIPTPAKELAPATTATTTAPLSHTTVPALTTIPTILRVNLASCHPETVTVGSGNTVNSLEEHSNPALPVSLIASLEHADWVRDNPAHPDDNALVPHESIVIEAGCSTES